MDIMLDNILKLMGSKHGSAKELTDYIGIKSSAVTDWKSGRNKSYIKHGPKIAEYFNVSLDYLAGMEQEKDAKKEPATNKDDGLDRELITRLCNLTPEEVQKVDAFVQGILAAR